MKFSISCEVLLKPLQTVINVVQKRHTMAVLSNLLLKAKDNTLTIVATDLEIEMIVHANINLPDQDGEITVPARKFFDIVRSLATQDDAMIDISTEKNQMTLKSGRSRFTLSTLAAKDFPSIEGDFKNKPVEVPYDTLNQILHKTNFAMAQQDVRYFLNGVLLEITDKEIRMVATDGHRLATASAALQGNDALVQVIVPRKAVLELMRLIQDQDGAAKIYAGAHHIRVELANVVFTSKLLDGRYPDYKRVIPVQGKHILNVDKNNFKQALHRTAILSNEKYRGVRLNLSDAALKLMTNNPEQEAAEDEIEAQYQGDALEIGFNIGYLLDVINAIEGDVFEMSLTGANSSALIKDPADKNATFVIMPIKL